MSARKYTANLALRLLFVISMSILIVPQFAALPGCGGDDESTPTGPGPHIENPPDTIPPAAVTTLHTEAATFESVALVWNAPGDDGTTGKAEFYDIRYATFEIDESTWDQATLVDPSRIPPPSESGKIETIVIMNLDSGTDYWFALKAVDDDDNVSALSNSATVRTKDEGFPPAEITDLKAVATGTLDYNLIFTSTGDDYNVGTATSFEVRYSTLPIRDDEDWNAATVITPDQQPKPSGEPDTVQVSVAIEDGLYFFAMRAVDELGNWSGRSNTAMALGWNFDLAFSPAYVHEGDFTTIVFRAGAGVPTWVAIQRATWPEILCGDDPNILKYLVREDFEEGIYSVTYDFFDEANNRYHEYDFYYVTLCHGGHMIQYEWISFRE
jgi:hypothetical protein